MTPTLNAPPKNRHKKNNQKTKNRHPYNKHQKITKKKAQNKYKDWPKHDPKIKKTTQILRSHQPPNPSFCYSKLVNSKCLVRTLGRPRSRVRRRRMQHHKRFNRMLTPMGQPCKCSLSQAQAKMFPSDGVVGRSIHLSQNLNLWPLDSLNHCCHAYDWCKAKVAT